MVDLLGEHLEDPQWREVALLTIGYMGIVQQRDEAAGEVLLRLMARPGGTPGAAVVLAGEAVLDTWPGGVTPRCRQAVVEALLQTMTDDDQVEPRVRARAGSLLGALGDPRNLEETVLVPAGPFHMGDDDSRYDDEKPAHQVQLAAFHIARYPVTNSQYARFVDAVGHHPPAHWRAKTPPREFYNHPVVNVSWYDALAYCKWLTEVCGEPIRMPTEAEWEKAARGTDGRRYPWGDGAYPNRANYGDSGIGSTSAVGCFPGGASPYGCEDMAGNVCEWTSTSSRSYPYDPADGREALEEDLDRTLHGGSFGNDGYYLRCASRDGSLLHFGDVKIGFWVVRP